MCTLMNWHRIPPPLPPEKFGAAASRILVGALARHPDLVRASRKTDGGAAEGSTTQEQLGRVESGTGPTPLGLPEDRAAGTRPMSEARGNVKAGQVKTTATITHDPRQNLATSHRINAFLRKARRFGLCSPTCLFDVSEYLRLVDSRLFNRIQSPSHCLSHVLPPEKHHHGLRPRGHSYTLPICPNKVCKSSFIPRCLFCFLCIAVLFCCSLTFAFGICSNKESSYYLLRYSRRLPRTSALRKIEAQVRSAILVTFTYCSLLSYLGRFRIGYGPVNCFCTRLLSSSTDEYVHTYYISTY